MAVVVVDLAVVSVVDLAVVSVAGLVVAVDDFSVVAVDFSVVAVDFGVVSIVVAGFSVVAVVAVDDLAVVVVSFEVVAVVAFAVVVVGFVVGVDLVSEPQAPSTLAATMTSPHIRMRWPLSRAGMVMSVSPVHEASCRVLRPWRCWNEAVLAPASSCNPPSGRLNPVQRNLKPRATGTGRR